MQEVCFQYWPDEGATTFGKYTIEHLGEEAHRGFVERSLNVTYSKVYLMLTSSGLTK